MEIIEKLQIPTKLLNISEVKVIESYINTNKEIIIKVSSTKEDRLYNEPHKLDQKNIY